MTLPLHVTTPLKLVAVVVTHNRLDKLRVTIDRLLAEDVDRIIVFDNASSDGTEEWLSTFSDTRLILRRSNRNLGGAGGFSKAMAWASKTLDPDWMVIMDDDGYPTPGAITKFRQVDWQDWDAVGAAVFSPDGQICEMNRPYRNPFWHFPEFIKTLSGKGRRGFHLDDLAYRSDAPIMSVDMSSFVGFFISRKAICRAGFPLAELFIYGDDQLYTLQMRRKNLNIAFAPMVRFEHDTAAHRGQNGVILQPLWKVYYMYRNALVAYRVAAGIWFWPLLPVLLIKWHRQGVDYGSDSSNFRRILNFAVKDGLRRQLMRSHDDILQFCTKGEGF